MCFSSQAKLETKALKAKRPGFTDDRYNETSYYIENGKYEIEADLKCVRRAQPGIFHLLMAAFDFDQMQIHNSFLNYYQILQESDFILLHFKSSINEQFTIKFCF